MPKQIVKKASEKLLLASDESIKQQKRAYWWNWCQNRFFKKQAKNSCWQMTKTLSNKNANFQTIKQAARTIRRRSVVENFLPLPKLSATEPFSFCPLCKANQLQSKLACKTANHEARVSGWRIFIEWVLWACAKSSLRCPQGALFWCALWPRAASCSLFNRHKNAITFLNLVLCGLERLLLFLLL